MLISPRLIYSEFFPKDNQTERIDQNFEIEPPGTMFQIIQVILHAPQHLFHRIRIPVVKGCIGGHAGPNLIQISKPHIVLKDLIDVKFTFRTRSDECHIAAEHIPQLRQFVQMMSTQEPADFRQPRIVIAAAVT